MLSAEGSTAALASACVTLCYGLCGKRQILSPILMRRYPLGDPNLQLVYDVIGVLTTVHRWAFSTRGWHLRLEISAASATMTGSAAAACIISMPSCCSVRISMYQTHCQTWRQNLWGRQGTRMSDLADETVLPIPAGSGGSMQHAWEQPNSPPGHASHFVPGGSLHKDISQVHLVAEGQQTGPSAAKCRARDPPQVCSSNRSATETVGPPCHAFIANVWLRLQDLSSQALDNNSVPATPL